MDQEEKVNTRINKKIQQSTTSAATWEETKVNEAKEQEGEVDGEEESHGPGANVGKVR